jgi:hypothetical protein
MSRSELQEVQALLVRILPDPSGFAGRLLNQAMGQWGQATGPTATAFYTATTAEDYTATTAENFTVSETVIAPERPTANEGPVDINILLAAALGACECWGMQADCCLCQGQGSAGWTQPESDLFDEFVRPAIARLAGGYADGRAPDTSVTADEDDQHHQTAQEVDA